MVTMNTRPTKFLTEEVAVALQNLQLCRKLCELLQEYDATGNRPAATLRFFGAGSTPEIQSTNSGFVATPVIFTAIIDIRKFTGFFGYSGSLMKKTKSQDDFDITDLGLPYPSLDDFFTACFDPSFSQQEFEEALRYLLTYANKMIAHFTTVAAASDVYIRFRKIDIVCMGITNAMYRLVYDALGLKHPNLRFDERDA
jgi:hypothetical protein